MYDDKKRKKPSTAANSKSKKTKSAETIPYNGIKIPFPKPYQQFNENSEQLYCICRRVDNGDLMVGCDNCDDWYHFNCLKLNRKFEKLYYKFYCPYCELENSELTSQFKKKCLLNGCFEPIMENSKFCNKKHGLEYFENIKNLTKNLNNKEIITILNNVELKDFHKLGNELPKPNKKEFQKFLNDSNEFNEELSIIKKNLQDLNISKDYIEFKKYLYFVIKDELKSINEYFNKFQNDENDDKKPKKKKKTSKKFEVCGYNKLLSKNRDQLESCLNSDLAKRYFKNDNTNDENKLLNYELINEEFFEKDFLKLKQMFTTIETFKDYQKNLETENFQQIFPFSCLQEKKKCSKHNGWQSRINDDIFGKLEFFKQKENDLIYQIDQLNEKYVVEFWERKEAI